MIPLIIIARSLMKVTLVDHDSAPDGLAPWGRYLLDNERILWEGKPDPHVRFNNNDIYLVPFSLLFGGFSLIWESLALSGAYKHSASGGEILFMPLFGLPFVIFGLYIMFGRLWVKAESKRKTRYAITDRRALLHRTFMGEAFLEKELDKIGSISFNKGLFGSSSLTFEGQESGSFSPLTNSYRLHENTGMEFLSRGASGGPLVFYDIGDTDLAFRVAQDARKQSRSRDKA